MGGGSLPVASAEAVGTPDAAADETAENSSLENQSQLNTDDQDVVDAAASGESAFEPENAGADVVLPAGEIINQEMAIAPVAQKESTRSYFLATTLESTRTVPIVSANLPLDTGVVAEAVEPAEGEGDFGAVEGEGGEDSDESDLAAAPVAAESTVVGSFEYRGITYAVEPGGESVAVVAADGKKLPSEFVEAQTIVLPAAVTADGADYYAVTRIADHAFAGLASDIASPYVISSDSEKSALLVQNREAVTDSTEDIENAESSTDGAIATITIPASVATVDEGAFTGFDTLRYAVVSTENPNYTTYDGALYDADGTSLLLIPEGRAGVVRVLSQTESVDPAVFSHCAVETVLVGADRPYLTSEDDVYNKNDEPVEVVALDLDDEEELAAYPQPYTADYDELVAALGGDGSEPSSEEPETLSLEVEEQIAHYAITAADRQTDLYDRLLEKYEHDRFVGDDSAAIAGLADSAYEVLNTYAGVQTLGGNVGNGGFWMFTEGDPRVTANDGLLTLTIWCEGNYTIPYIWHDDPSPDSITMRYDIYADFWGPVRPYVERVIMLEGDAANASNAYFKTVTGHAAATITEIRSQYGMPRWCMDMKRLTKTDEIYLAATIDYGLWKGEQTSSGLNFEGMFYGCSSLEKVTPNMTNPRVTFVRNPMFSGKTVGWIHAGSYWNFFGNCTSLVTIEEGCQMGPAPSRDANNITRYYMERSFLGCTSLSRVPNSYVVPETAYIDMDSGATPLFGDCTSLVSIDGEFTLNNWKAYRYTTPYADYSSLAPNLFGFTATSSSDAFKKDSSSSSKLRTYYDSADLSALYPGTGDADSYWRTNYGRLLQARNSNVAEFFVPRCIVMDDGVKSWISWRDDTGEVASGGYTTSQRTIRNGVIEESLPVPAASQDGYIFKGWYLDPLFEKPFEFGTTNLDEYATLWARFDPVFTFNANGGELNEVKQVELVSDEYDDEALPVLTGNWKPSFDGYEFVGFYDAPVGGTQYFDAEGNPAMKHYRNDQGLTLYAHWKYKIALDANVHNFMNSAGDEITATIDSDFPGLDYDENGTAYIEALYGEPIQLPTVSREGYEDTRAWGVQCGTNDNAGRAFYILPMADVEGSFWSVKSATDKTKVAPTASQLIVNGGTATNAPAFKPKADNCTVTLYADWSGNVEGLGDSLGGEPKTYKVKLVSAYEYTGADGKKTVYKATDGTPTTLENVAYNSPISVPANMTAPTYKTDGSTYNTLVFSGFWTEPNGPAPEVRDADDDEAIATYAGSEMIKRGTGSDADKLIGSQPFRKVTTDSNDYVLLYALWTFPFSDVVFHMNTDALEAPLADYADATKDTSKLFCKTGTTPLKLTVETNSATPALVQDNGQPTEGGFTAAQLASAAIGRAGYTFNGWWTHPYLETGTSSVQYYDAQNKVTHENWDPYANTVLYAHWKYNITFDRGSGDNTWETWHKGTTMPANFATDADNNKYLSDAYGNRYYYANYDEGGKGLQLMSITAIAGAPVKLPYACGRTGYDDTRAWSQSTKSDTVSGLTASCVPTDAEGFSLASSADGALRAKPAVTPASGTVLLYPYWGDSAKKVSIVLVNSYGDYATGSFVDTPVEVALKDTQNNDVKAVYDRALNASTDVAVAAPQLNGYTFTGYFNADGSQRFFAPKAAATEGGRMQATPTSEVWHELADSGVVKLYAHYERDAYRVEFDLSVPCIDATSGANATKTPGTQTVDDYDRGTDALKAITWNWGDTMGGKEFPSASKVENQGAFFRNGYDFDGWYYLGENGTPVMVSNDLGEGASIMWRPSYAWQTAHKADEPAIKLYAAWTAKTYALRFNPKYKGEDLSQNWIPNATVKASWPNSAKMEQRGGVWYYTVRYEEPITPFYADGVAADPTFKKYTFNFWGTNDAGTGASSANKLTLNDDHEAVFMPAYPLSTKTATSNAEVPRTIDFYGDWSVPGNVSVTFFAGDHGAFTSGDAKKYTIASVSYEWDATLDENSPLWDFIHPQDTQAGYRFMGYVWADENGNYTDADGNLLGSPYDAEGELRNDVKTVTRLNELTRNTYLVAVYARNKFEVNLVYPSDATLRTSTDDGAYRDGWWVSDNEYTTRYPFDVESGAFRLPDDVTYAGKNFAGWYRVKTTDDGTEVVDTSKRYTTIDPLAIATGNPEDRTQKFKADFTEKVYKVSFVPNHPNGDEAAEIATVYLDYDGRVLGGTLADTGEATMNQLLERMPGAPYPYTKTTDKSHGTADATAAGDHYHSYPFSQWKIGITDPSSLEVKAANAKVTVEDWHRWFDTAGFAVAIDPTTLEAGSADAQAKVTDEMRVFGVWNEAYNAVVPLYVNMVVDTDTAKVAIPERDYGIFSMNGKLEVSALRYESVEDESGNVFANAAGEPVYLSVFIDRTSAPDMGEPKIDAVTGEISGDYGTGGDRTKLLQLDLTGKARTVYKSELANYGFRAFDGNAMRIHYALDLNGVHKSTLSAMRLPDATKAPLDEKGWTQGVPVAKLHYTVQRVLSTN